MKPPAFDVRPTRTLTKNGTSNLKTAIVQVEQPLLASSNGAEVMNPNNPDPSERVD